MTAIQLKSLATGVDWEQLDTGGIGLASSRQLFAYERGTENQVQVAP